jgi:mono/diheme cytochrome c family protein
MKTLGKAGRRVTLVLVGVGVCALASCATIRAPVSGDGIQALDDPDVIERGRYLVFGPAHCAACHGDPGLETDMRLGIEIPLSGGRSFDVGPLGIIVTPNITNDPVAGIGAMSDEALVRGLRYGVSRHDRPLLPFMPFADLADADLQAIISFLRTTTPVDEPAPESRLTWLGAFAAQFIIEPQQPTTRPPLRRPAERTAEYGRYLAITVANCHGCHTQRSRLTGAFIGPAFAGGMKLTEPDGTFVTPNLTPVADSVVSNRTEEEFIGVFRARGSAPTPSPMPWAAFGRMTDADLGAIYRYLKSLPPAPMPERGQERG